MGYTENLIDFIGKSTDCYHAVKTAKDRLDENGFTELLEGDKWDVQSGGKYYVIRNSSSIIAFEMPKKDFKFHAEFNGKKYRAVKFISSDSNDKACNHCAFELGKCRGAIWVLGQCYVVEGNKVVKMYTIKKLNRS